MFSPSQLIQSFVQKAPISAPKPVELTPGQVFKGTVIKHYPDNMALVQVGGMQVQAKMEASLEPGQKAWLQVQPSTGVVTLKVLESVGEGAGKEASLEGLMRSLGIADTKENKAIVQALLGANLPVNKETIQAFSAVAGRLGVDNATIEAFMTAMKRSLPLTPDTIGGLKAFLSDKPMGQLIQNLLQQASLFLEGEGQPSHTTGQMSQSQSQQVPGQANATTGDVKQLVSQLKDKLTGLSLLIAGNDATDEGLAVKQMPQGNQPNQGASQNATGGSQTQPLSSQSGQPTSQVQTSPQPLTQASSNIPSPSQAVSSTVSTETVPVPNTAGKQVESQPNAMIGKSNQLLPNQTSDPSVESKVARNESLPIPQSSQTNQEPIQNKQVAEQRAVVTEAGQKVIPQMMSQASGVTNGATTANPIAELFRHLGVTHERELMGQAFSQGAIDSHSLKQMDTVKSLLLQISQASAQTLPTALREAADQLLQQVTGQQLMMVQPSNQALSQIVMQIPIRQADGDETAFVQIESKKKGSGQLDPENCRLFFHLELQSMGTTMIDVSIVNRIVNLQIFNDTPWVEALIQGSKDRFADQLQDVGYHLSAMRVQQVPADRGKSTSPIQTKGPILADYKGVDLRV
ncbi:flagellar hook-length control protein FliK [Brevibacillus brevis]|uniref:Flagellar hook-length control protein FliK n=1 Tax=Brevibacillus brevis TaxID=1393 RepID=A0A2Z4MKG2_BREBE|nr:flagellar hook-length control protein FliK [Brevibacillus brevis]AWX56954.1 flagellar hook-length control protein FliK [Brevibacillus brevis]